MTDRDSKTTILFNGEIYNYQLLRRMLEKKGYNFESSSDTEVLLKMFLEYGEDCFSLLRGMWAVVIWDAPNKTLVISRDRLGLKPLYVYEEGDETVYSSEPSALVKYTNRKDRVNVDWNSAYRFLARGWQDITGDTAFDSISAFAPATIRTIRSGRTYSRKYWALKLGQYPELSPQELYTETCNVVKQHLQSDGDVAIALSGGLDSSSIACIASKELGEGAKITGYSLLVPGTISEKETVDQIVSDTGIKHNYVSAPNKISDLLVECIVAHGEPLPVVNHFYQYFLRKVIAQDSQKVVVTGDGADEIFGGYMKMIPMYIATLLAQKEKRSLSAYLAESDYSSYPLETQMKLMETARNILRGSSKGYRSCQIETYGSELLSADYVRRTNITFPACPYHALIRKDQAKDFLYREMLEKLWLDIPVFLRIEDRNSAAYGLENRCPFLDHILVEIGLSYKELSYRESGYGKTPLRRAVQNIITPEVLSIRKKAHKPGNNALVVYDLLEELIVDIFSGCELRNLGIFNRNLLDHYRKDKANQNIARSYVWFRYLTFAIWYQKVLSNSGSV